MLSDDFIVRFETGGAEMTTGAALIVAGALLNLLISSSNLSATTTTKKVRVLTESKYQIKLENSTTWQILRPNLDSFFVAIFLVDLINI